MIGWLAASPLVRALALALLHFVWQGALLALALWVLLRLIGRSAAGLRYLVSCCALALAAALPLLTARALWPGSPPPAPPAGPDIAPAPLPWHAYATLALVAAWLACAVLRLARIGVGLQRIRALLSRCAPLRDEVAERALRMARRMGLSRLPRLLETDHIDAPMAVGWLKPAVLIPVSAITALPPAQIDALIAHELAHVRRHDFLVNLLAEVVLAVLFFHPAVHFIARSIHDAREHAADDEAASQVTPSALAHALFALEAHRTQPPELSLGSTGGDLMFRIQRLIKSGPPSPRRAALPALAAAGALFALALVGLGSCGGAGETAAPIVGPQAATALHIRWLPPVLSPYKALFEGAAHEHGVDADVLAIVALIESAGDPDAQSSAGALGLMQIMPKTGALIAEERGVAGFAPERLREPSLNVDFGAYYFAQQASTLAAGEEGAAQVALASAAYNAGPKAVRAHLDSGQPLPEETQKYRELVVGMYEERSMDRSATFDGWRGRVQARAASKAVTPVTEARVTAPFGGPGAHDGVDLAAKAGTPVLSPLDGTVVSTEQDDRRGRVVVVRHRSGIETRYHHLDDVAVKAGDRVTRGDSIGTVGSTGVVTGPHVHFEVRDLGTPVDPGPYVSKPR
jgi:bla regulator protein BlaR1